MACSVCGSGRQKEFPSEINIHPPRGLKHLSTPGVFAFPRLMVCLDCGSTEFVLEEGERNELVQRHEIERPGAGQSNDADVPRVRRIAASKLN
jgi:hypothetical protein